MQPCLLLEAAPPRVGAAVARSAAVRAELVESHVAYFLAGIFTPASRAIYARSLTAISGIGR